MQKSIARASKMLSPEELTDAQSIMSQRTLPKPYSILDLIGKFTLPKKSTIVIFDPHPELVPPASLLFKQVHVVETNDAVRKLMRGMLFNLGLNDTTCSGRFPERGEYNTIYVGKPENKNMISFPMVPSGALLIFLRLNPQKFAAMSNSGFSLIYPNATVGLDTAELCILKKN